MSMNFAYDSMSIFDIGSQQCEPGHHWSIGYIDRYLIHYIIKGKGKFLCKDKEYQLKRGNAFLITGEKGGYYQADNEDPWQYIWINISGGVADNFLNAVSLSRNSPVYETSRPDIIEKCFSALLKIGDENSFLVSGAFFTLMGEMIRYNSKKIIPERKSPKEYVNMYKNYISVNSYRRITVKSLCEYVGLEHSYLYRLFMEEEKTSPCEYIMNYKLKKAKQLLRETSLSVGAIASSVGYEDALAFSKLFSKKEGMPPTAYRENQQILT